MLAMYKGKPIFGPSGPSGPDGNPIGTIISYMGFTAPKDYLICDGSLYNIADYYSLSQFFKTQFGTVNYFGGDGTTTFAVPDLRGEFLRGSGSANRNSGAGGGVGEHQDPTQVPFSILGDGEVLNLYYGSYNNMDDTASANMWIYPMRTDRYWYVVQPKGATFRPSSTFLTNKNDGTSHFSVRPTNTSILYCIKAVAAESYENVYSTEETRIGTWIDGKPLYRKVITGTTPSVTGSYTKAGDISALNVDTCAKISCVMLSSSGVMFSVPNTGASSDVSSIVVFPPEGSVSFLASVQAHTNRPFWAILEYTKTTDTAPASLLSTEETVLTSEVEIPTSVSANGEIYDVSLSSSTSMSSEASSSSSLFAKAVASSAM